MRRFVILFILLNFITQPSFAQRGCRELIKSIGFEETSRLTAQDLAVAAKTYVETSPRTAIQFLKEKRGYAVLIGTMIGSAALTSYLTARLPPHFAFLSQLLSQLSTLGVYVFGSPIWEPISSGFRKFAFGVSKGPSTTLAFNAENERLEATWVRTQENYSLNSQMSRNIINLFISSTRQNFYEAFHAIHSGNSAFAASQVAEAAVRMRFLFKDIQADDPSVRVAVRSAFSNYLVDDAFYPQVRNCIEEYDSEFKNDLVKVYYDRLIAAWLLNKEQE